MRARNWRPANWKTAANRSGEALLASWITIFGSGSVLLVGRPILAASRLSAGLDALESASAGRIARPTNPSYKLTHYRFSHYIGPRLFSNALGFGTIFGNGCTRLHCGASHRAPARLLPVKAGPLRHTWLGRLCGGADSGAPQGDRIHRRADQPPRNPAEGVGAAHLPVYAGQLLDPGRGCGRQRSGTDQPLLHSQSV